MVGRQNSHISLCSIPFWGAKDSLSFGAANTWHSRWVLLQMQQRMEHKPVWSRKDETAAIAQRKY